MKWFLLFLVSFTAHAAHIVSENSHLSCEELKIFKELRVYKDPSLFLGNLSEIYSDPSVGWERLMKENPLLTTIKGAVQVMRLGPEREFKNFGAIAKIYELADPQFKKKGEKSSNPSSNPMNPKIVPIKICGGDAYGETMGFVLVSDLKKAQVEEFEPGVLPPSTVGNPVPKLRKSPYWD